VTSSAHLALAAIRPRLAELVLVSRDWLEVKRAHAQDATTQMIEHAVLRNRTDFLDVEHLIRADRLATAPHDRATVAAELSRPQVTAVDGVDVE
jgi:hypothetical protein